MCGAGLPGFGKTYYVKHGLRSDRSLVIDPHAALDRFRDDGKREPWDGELVLWSELLEHRFDILRAGTGRVVIDPQCMDEVRLGHRVETILDLVWKAGGDWDIVLEEAGLYSRRCVNMLNLLATGGGHNGIRLILLVQSVGRIHIDARRNFSAMALWPQAENEDYVDLRWKVGLTGVKTLTSMRPRDPPVTWVTGQVPKD